MFQILPLNKLDFNVKFGFENHATSHAISHSWPRHKNSPWSPSQNFFFHFSLTKFGNSFAFRFCGLKIQAIYPWSLGFSSFWGYRIGRCICIYLVTKGCGTRPFFNSPQARRDIWGSMGHLGSHLEIPFYVKLYYKE